MHSLSSFALFGALALNAVFALPWQGNSQADARILRRDVTSFVATEQPIALNNLLCNIGSAGACVSGASSGLVIASPSKSSPDCM